MNRYLARDSLPVKDALARPRRGRSVAGWAVAYLVAAGSLIAVAGRELTGPSLDERAAEAQDRAGTVLESVARAAARHADSWARERRRREKERASLVRAALPAGMLIARELGRGLGPGGRPSGERIRAVARLGAPPRGVAPLQGVALAVIGPDGSTLFETGGTVDFESPRTVVRSTPDGMTVAAAWAEELPERRAAAAEALAVALSPRVRAGKGLYFVSPDGDIATVVAPRPVPAAPLARGLEPLAPGALSHGRVEAPADLQAAGDCETGRLITARCLSTELGWTAVAETFLSPDELAGGRGSTLGMVALTALGLIAAGAFAHAVRAGLVGRERGTGQAPASRPCAPLRVPAGHAGEPAVRTRRPVVSPRLPATGAPQSENAPVPVGGSIQRLRESLGTSGAGPDLAASARSPILRALSRYVRAPRAPELPADVLAWGATVESGARDAGGASPAPGEGAAGRRGPKQRG